MSSSNPPGNSSRWSELARAVEKAKRELEQMIDLHPHIMLLVDAEGRIVRANRALLRLVGACSFPEVLGRPVREVLQVPVPTESSHPAETTMPGVPAELRISGQGRERVLRWYWVGSAREGNLRVAIVEDVTERRNDLLRLQKACKKEAVEALMGALMHRLNQPLTVILVTARLMHLAIEEGRCNPEEMQRYLRQIMDLTLEISRTLERLQRPTDYITEDYLEGLPILDIERCAGKKPRPPREEGQPTP